MELSELLALLHYEVQKTYNFVEAISKTDGNKNTSVLHMALEKIEIDLPVSLEERQITFDPNKVKELPIYMQKFSLPYTAQSVAQNVPIPKKKFKGKVISAKVVGSFEKIDEGVIKENIGRIKVVLKPIIT